MHSVSSVVIALLLATSVALVGNWPIYALNPESEQPSTPPASSASSPLLDALAFAAPEIISFQFTDWIALKALHDGSDITSASPLEERQRLVLDMVHSEASQFGFGLARLATWPELWGWDNTDLAWEATWDSWFDSSAKVLRFRAGWDPKPFMARLEGYGYSRREKPYGTLFSDPPDFHPDPGTEAILDTDERLAPWPVSVAISPDGRTVAIAKGERADRVLGTAARADPADTAASPFGRVAVALGRPLTGFIADGEDACRHQVAVQKAYDAAASTQGVGYSRAADDAAALASAIGPLHPYRAVGVGYERAGPGEPAVGRYVFTYREAKQARADLPGRRTLIDEGYAWDGRRHYRDVAFGLVDASVDGRELVLDVAPVHDAPELIFDHYWSQYQSFAMCE